MTAYIKRSSFSKRLLIIILPVVLSLLLYLLLFLQFVIPDLKSNLLEAKKELILEETHTVLQLLGRYQKRVKSGELDLRDAQRRALNNIRALRYGADLEEYFWVLDLQAVMLAHPYSPDLDNQKLDRYRDKSGKLLFRDMVELVKQNGSGYLEYFWQKQGNKNIVEKKISYVAGFKEWSWIVGTGIYMGDVEKSVSATVARMEQLFLIVFFGMILLLSFIMIYAGKREMDHLAIQIEKETSDKKYKILTEKSQDIIYQIDIPSQKFSYISAAAEEITGYRAAEFMNNPDLIFQMIHEDYSRDFKKEWDESLRSGLQAIHDFKIVRKDGEERWINIRSNLILDNNSMPVVVQGVIRDITKRKEIEESAKGFSQLFEDALNEIFIFDKKDWKLIHLNKSALRNLDYSKQDLLGKSFLDLIKPITETEFSDLIKPLFSEQQENIVFTTEFSRKNESTYPVEVHLQTSGYEKQTVFVAFVWDITERRKAELKLKENQAELEQKVKERTAELEEYSKFQEESQKALANLLEDVNESRQELGDTVRRLEDANKELEAFSYSVSHDLRAPLRAIDGFTKIFYENHQDDLETEDVRLINIIRENAQKMNLLISDLLEFSRTSRKKLKRSIIDLNSLLNQVKDELLMSELNRQIEIEIDELPKIKGDVSMVKQVITNLLSNAIKFTRNESQARINITCSEDEDYYEICFEDNGVGFKMQYAEKLFQVFQRLHNEEDFEGTGVGLAIVYRIIKRHNGMIRAESKSGEWTRFYVSIPK